MPRDQAGAQLCGSCKGVKTQRLLNGARKTNQTPQMSPDPERSGAETRGLLLGSAKKDVVLKGDSGSLGGMRIAEEYTFPSSPFKLRFWLPGRNEVGWKKRTEPQDERKA